MLLEYPTTYYFPYTYDHDAGVYCLKNTRLRDIENPDILFKTMNAENPLKVYTGNRQFCAWDYNVIEITHAILYKDNGIKYVKLSDGPVIQYTTNLKNGYSVLITDCSTDIEYIPCRLLSNIVISAPLYQLLPYETLGDFIGFKVKCTCYHIPAIGPDRVKSIGYFTLINDLGIIQQINQPI